MIGRTTFIGLGEAGMALAVAGACGYDRKLDDAGTRGTKLADFASVHITACDDMAQALRGANVVLSLVTADQALAASIAAARFLEPGVLWLDMNSVAPETKRAAAAVIEPTGRYVDVAVMAPVDPAGRGAPLLLAGPHRDAGAKALRAAGFTSVGMVGARVGDASAIKMIRSVMVKGLEALSAECVIAAEAAGVRREVVASLDASWPGADWERRFDYNLDRMLQHGERRAAEMEEAVKTLDALGTGSVMTQGTVTRQRAIGALHLPPPSGLDAKLGHLSSRLPRRPEIAA